MHAPRTSFRISSILLLVLALLGAALFGRSATGTPAPKAMPYALLYIPKKMDRAETVPYRHRQIDSIRSRSVLYAAIRSLKNTDLPSLPKKGKGEGVRDDHDDDVAWMEKNLKIEFLNGTGIVHISLVTRTTATPREQARLVNAVAYAYRRDIVLRDKKLNEITLESLKTELDILQQTLRIEAGGRKANIERNIEETKAGIKRLEFELQTLPQVLELADVPR